jgi:hypothetical protein
MRSQGFSMQIIAKESIYAEKIYRSLREEPLTKLEDECRHSVSY